MWIVMLETFGAYPKGHKLDLPPDVIERIPNDCYKKTYAPWDEHKDTKAIKLTAAQNAANDLQGRVERFAAEAEELKQKADSLVAPTSQKQAEAKKAEQVAKQEIARAEKAAENAKKAPSEQNAKLAADLKRNAWQLARESERRSAEFQLAHSELSAALAKGELKRLDAEEAKKRAKAAVKALDKLKEKIAIAKAKETTDAKSETEQPADTIDGPVDEQIDQSVEQPVSGKSDKPVAKGQADKAGQAGQ